MKKRFAFNRQRRGRELIITSNRGESLDTRRAKWLAESFNNVLVRFYYDMAHNDEFAMLHYDVKDLVSLKSFVKRVALSDDMYVRMLDSVQNALDTCSTNRIPTELLMFDPAYVFVDEYAYPRFVVVPLENMPFTLMNSPLTMLRLLGNPRKLSFTSPAGEMLSSKLEAFVLNQNNVFSANAYRAFLRNECGVAQPRQVQMQEERPHKRGGLSQSEETSLRMWNGVDNNNGLGYVGKVTRLLIQRVSNGETYPIEMNRPVSLGRGSRNDVQLTGNPKISRSHARIVCTDTRVVITDLSSANGTWVQGSRLETNKAVSILMDQEFSLADEKFVVSRV